MALRVAIYTVGCRANQADSDRLSRALDPRLVEVVDGSGAFDLAVINTCCVTAEAERDSRKLARRAGRSSPRAGVVVTGCAVSAIEGFGDGLGRGVELRGGGGDDPLDLARWISARAERHVGGEPGGAPVVPASGRSRPLLKVQNGCSHGCAYCVVPAARGPERSNPLREVIERAGQLAAEGFGEIVLTGVQLGAWGRDLPGGPRVARLVREVADRIAPARVRLSSIEPWSVDDELLEVVAGHDRVCSHLHVPLQSGDDRVLAAMGRGHTAEKLLDLARRAREIDPDLALGTDVLCGFPGEDLERFASTLDVLRQLAPSYVHAFSFSKRPGTRAAELPGEVDRHEVKRRVAEVIAFGERETRRYRERQAGQVREVVVEAREGAGWRGLTDTFVPVLISAGGLASGELVRVRLTCGDRSGWMAAVSV